jgi:hypothetical protein
MKYNQLLEYGLDVVALNYICACVTCVPSLPTELDNQKPKICEAIALTEQEVFKKRTGQIPVLF